MKKTFFTLVGLPFLLPLLVMGQSSDIVIDNPLVDQQQSHRQAQIEYQNRDAFFDSDRIDRMIQGGSMGTYIEQHTEWGQTLSRKIIETLFGKKPLIEKVKPIGKTMGLIGTYLMIKDVTNNTFEPQDTRGASIIVPPKLKKITPPESALLRYKLGKNRELLRFDSQLRQWVGVVNPTTGEKKIQERLGDGK